MGEQKIGIINSKKKSRNIIESVIYRPKIKIDNKSTTIIIQSTFPPPPPPGSPKDPDPRPELKKIDKDEIVKKRIQTLIKNKYLILINEFSFVQDIYWRSAKSDYDEYIKSRSKN